MNGLLNRITSNQRLSGLSDLVIVFGVVLIIGYDDSTIAYIFIRYFISV